jgi:hypothetical protein
MELKCFVGMSFKLNIFNFLLAGFTYWGAPTSRVWWLLMMDQSDKAQK